MTPALTHPRVLGYLGRALSLELSAVQQQLAAEQELHPDDDDEIEMREEGARRRGGPVHRNYRN